MTSRFEQALTAALVVAACAVAVAMVRGPRVSARGMQPSVGPPEQIPAWPREGSSVGRLLAGPDVAPVTMTVFGDLECAACAAFDSKLEAVLSRFGDRLNVVFVHYPLSYHRFALPAARGAECAARIGAFTNWVRAIYAGQDSLGLKTWAAFAATAGIADTAEMQRCATGTQSEARIQEGLALGKELAIMGTPTILLNDWRFRSVPSVEQIEAAVDRLLAGRPLHE